MEPWYKIAIAEIGVKEKRGGENPRILEYHATTTLRAREDEIPWCSAFVNWCMVQAGFKGTDSAAAKSWLSWGVPITEPKEGAICVVRKKQPGSDALTGSASGYHVAFLDGLANGRVYLLGGNQSDQVKISGFNLASYEIVGLRWPA